MQLTVIALFLMMFFPEEGTSRASTGACFVLLCFFKSAHSDEFHHGLSSLERETFPGISFTSAQISLSQWSSGGVGNALDPTSALLSYGLTPVRDENIYQEMDLLEPSKGFERDHTEMKFQECVRAAQASRTPSLLILHGSFQNSGMQREDFNSGFSNYVASLASKGPPREATSF